MALKEKINPATYSYVKEGILTRWHGEPLDIRDSNGHWLGVTLFDSVRKPEGVRVEVRDGARVIGEHGSVVRSSKSKILSQESFKIISADTGEKLAEVIYSENPNSPLRLSDLG